MRPVNHVLHAAAAVTSLATLALAAAVLAAPGEAPAPEKPSPFEARLLEIAKGYTAYGRVDDEMRWAPQLCRMPMPGSARFSASKDEGTHGHKLYSLFAAKRGDYVPSIYQLTSPKERQPVGQVLVKESWLPEEAKDGDKLAKPEVRKVSDGKQEHTDSFTPYAQKDGKTYRAAKLAGLYVMYKLDPETEGTDNGWVYGTMTADGMKVTAAGKVESCMGCHTKAKHDRMFGLPQKGTAEK